MARVAAARDSRRAASNRDVLFVTINVFLFVNLPTYLFLRPVAPLFHAIHINK